MVWMQNKSVKITGTGGEPVLLELDSDAALEHTLAKLHAAGFLHPVSREFVSSLSDIEDGKEYRLWMNSAISRPVRSACRSAAGLEPTPLLGSTICVGERGTVPRACSMPRLSAAAVLASCHDSEL